MNGREVARHVTAVLPGVASKNIMSDMQASCWMQTLGSREFPQHALQAIHENALWDPMSKTLATARCDCGVRIVAVRRAHRGRPPCDHAEHTSAGRARTLQNCLRSACLDRSWARHPSRLDRLTTRRAVLAHRQIRPSRAMRGVSPSRRHRRLYSFLRHSSHKRQLRSGMVCKRCCRALLRDGCRCAALRDLAGDYRLCQ